MTDGDKNAYDECALAYAKSNESNAWNAYYERPAVLGLVGARPRDTTLRKKANA